MRLADADLAYLPAGTISAIVLGIALIPLRDFTSASNLTFPFLALTIAIAELGGPRAALATALGSALSLDFFLTKPYLQLTIEGKHDVIAFLGLAACGLVAAAFSSRRRRMIALLRVERRQLDLLCAALSRLETGGPIELVLTQVLDSTRTALTLPALAVRDEHDRIIAASPVGHGPRVPARLLRPDTLLPEENAPRVVPGPGLPLPDDGGRIPLVVRGRRVGWLDVWGSSARVSTDARHTLSAIGRLAGVMLLNRQRGRAGED